MFFTNSVSFIVAQPVVLEKKIECIVKDFKDCMQNFEF